MNSNGNGQVESVFTPDDVISTYTDAQACDDGVLIALNAKDRVTRSVWEWLAEKAPKTSRPPASWPVEMMTWFKAEKISREDAQKLIANHGTDAQKLFDRIITDRKAAALSRGIISANRQLATHVYEHNVGGGIFKKYAIENDGYIESLGDGGPVPRTKTLWLLPNENGGITLMFPEDY